MHRHQHAGLYYIASLGMSEVVAFKRTRLRPAFVVGLQEKALGPLLEWAEAAIPDSRWESTPIFLLATAGLRKLPEDYQNDVLDSAQSVLAASPFRYKPAWLPLLVAIRGIQGTCDASVGGRVY